MNQQARPEERAYAWNKSVACRTLEGTAFILLKSRMVSLNEVGTRIWELFESGSTVDHVGARIVAEFDVTPDVVESDVRAFVKELLAKEFLVPLDEEAKSSPPQRAGKA